MLAIYNMPWVGDTFLWGDLKVMRCTIITISRSKRNHILTNNYFNSWSFHLVFHFAKQLDDCLEKHNTFILPCFEDKWQGVTKTFGLESLYDLLTTNLTHPTPITAWILAITNNYRLRLYSSCRRKTRCITKCLSANNELLESVFWIRSLCVQ